MDYTKFLEKMKTLYPDKYDLIEKAFNLSREAHSGQKRYSGEEYFSHPVAVVEILLDFGVDYLTVISALLHDVLEDTDVPASVINEMFGAKVLEIVEGLTKLSQIQYHSTAEIRAENIRKMFFAMTKDVRVILIKLADRLHNMRSLEYRTPEKQRIVAKETLEIYAALAGRLGISFFKCELEDLAMQYLYPEEYKMIDDYLKDTKTGRDKAMKSICKDIADKLKELGIKGEVSGRIKHYYSILKKLKKLNVNIDQIYDLVAVRIIVENVDECYALLGTVHKLWKPIPDRIKDYITMPKPNGYQSLHTTVITEFDLTFEIQIRTFEMHKIAEYGVAAHWKYKEGTLGSETDLDSKVRWIREVIDTQKNMSDPEDFLDLLKIDVFKEEVFVFTPKGDVYNLSEGANAIDFAYAIHSAVGNKCVGVKINKKMVPLATKLKTGDIVEIITSNTSKGPSRDWLKIVKTSSARTKIKQFFKKETKEENIERGRSMLEHESKRRGYALSELVTDAWLEYTLNKFKFSGIDDIYAAVGYGEFSTHQVLTKMLEFFKKSQKEKEGEDEITVSGKERSRKRSAGGVLIRGFDDFSVRLSHCCNPVPGDKIIGYVSRGRGVSVHKANCPNVKNMEPERLIEAEWDLSSAEKYTTDFNIVAENRTGMLAEITTAVTNKHVPIMGANVKVDKENGTVAIQLAVEISSADELTELIKKLSSLQNVIKIYR